VDDHQQVNDDRCHVLLGGTVCCNNPPLV
jgi:hypothetical protein